MDIVEVFGPPVSSNSMSAHYGYYEISYIVSKVIPALTIYMI